MDEHARQAYAEVMRARYQLADRAGRGVLLDEYCRVTGHHRKAAIRALGRPRGRSGRRAGRPRRYGPELRPVLEQLWVASDYLSGKLLHAVLPTLLAALQQHQRRAVDPAAGAALQAASPATLDRLLRACRRRRGRAPQRLAPAVTAMRAQVPVRTWSEWADAAPGALQGDLVLHCGDSTEGFYLATLVGVDVASTWTDLQAVWGLRQQRVTGSVEHVSRRLPFALRAWHSDNGSEFVNRSLLDWCRRHGVAFSRGRPYRKNDQAWVEQRNGLLVRRLVGYDRYSSRAAYAVLQRLYGLVRVQHNVFRPVRKLVSKQRVGARVLKRYDRAQTPYQRLLALGVLSAEQQAALARQLAALDPIALARDIQHTLSVLWKLADTRRRLPEALRG